MRTTFFATLQRDLILAWRSRADIFVTLSFFVIVAFIFPFGLGADNIILKQVGPGVLWVAALLSTLLSLHRLFYQDYLDGTLEQLLLSADPAVLWVSAKMLAHWMVTGLPLVLAMPLLSLLFDLSLEAQKILAATLLLGTPILVMLGAVGAALTLGVRNGSVLLALLILPLFVPVLIFGAGSVDNYLAGMDISGNFYFLGSGLLAAAALTPFACAAALRIAVE